MNKRFFYFCDVMKVAKQTQKPIFVVKATFLANGTENRHNETIKE